MTQPLLRHEKLPLQYALGYALVEGKKVLRFDDVVDERGDGRVAYRANSSIKIPVRLVARARMIAAVTGVKCQLGFLDKRDGRVVCLDLGELRVGENGVRLEWGEGSGSLGYDGEKEPVMVVPFRRVIR